MVLLWFDPYYFFFPLLKFIHLVKDILGSTKIGPSIGGGGQNFLGIISTDKSMSRRGGGALTLT